MKIYINENIIDFVSDIVISYDDKKGRKIIANRDFS